MAKYHADADLMASNYISMNLWKSIIKPQINDDWLLVMFSLA